MDNSNFDLLIQRYLEGNASEQERAKIEAWLDVMKTKDTTGLELSKADEEKLFQRIISPEVSIKEVIAFQPQSGNNKGKTRFALQIAAALLVIISVSFVIWRYIDKPVAPLHVSSQNGVEKIILTDGTLVWLQPGSQLTYFEKKQDGTRNTDFQGEALFEVAKDASHPFIIKCGGVSLKVLGTSFSLKSRKDSVQLIVLTGKVNMTSSGNVNVDVSANEKVIFANREIEKVQLTSSEVPALTANTEYNMQFDNTTLEEVARKVSKKFNVDMNAETQIAKCRITADFTDHSLESTLQLITEVLNVKYSQKGNSVTITGHGCN